MKARVIEFVVAVLIAGTAFQTGYHRGFGRGRQAGTAETVKTLTPKLDRLERTLQRRGLYFIPNPTPPPVTVASYGRP